VSIIAALFARVAAVTSRLWGSSEDDAPDPNQLFVAVLEELGVSLDEQSASLGRAGLSTFVVRLVYGDADATPPPGLDVLEVEVARVGVTEWDVRLRARYADRIFEARAVHPVYWHHLPADYRQHILRAGEESAVFRLWERSWTSSPC